MDIQKSQKLTAAKYEGFAVFEEIICCDLCYHSLCIANFSDK